MKESDLKSFTFGGVRGGFIKFETTHSISFMGGDGRVKENNKWNLPRESMEKYGGRGMST